MKRLRRINAVFFALSFALGAILNSAVAGQGTQALGINTEGDIVGNYRDSSFLTHGFLLSHGTFTILDKRVFSPFGINPQGEIVGESLFGIGIHGFACLERAWSRCSTGGRAVESLLFGVQQTVHSVKKVRTLVVDRVHDTC